MSTGRESALPASWQTARARAAWWARVANAVHSVLVLDYDGTLAPFNLDRMAALPYPGVDQRLAKLMTMERVSVVLVTGRSCREIKRLYPLAEQMEVWASHGREHSSPGGVCEFIPFTDEQRAILHDVMADLTSANLPPSAVERKPASIAIHWRGLEQDKQETLRRRC
jgi:trehalose 6-phosphate phosphatase